MDKDYTFKKINNKPQKLYYITLEKNCEAIENEGVIRADNNGFTYIYDDYHKANSFIYRCTYDGVIDDRRQYSIMEVLDYNIDINKLYKVPNDNAMLYVGDIEVKKFGCRYGYEKTFKVGR